MSHVYLSLGVSENVAPHKHNYTPKKIQVHTQLTCLPAIEHSVSYTRRAFLRLLMEAVHVQNVIAHRRSARKEMLHIVSMSTGVCILSMSASFQYIPICCTIFPCQHDSTCVCMLTIPHVYLYVFVTNESSMDNIPYFGLDNI